MKTLKRMFFLIFVSFTVATTFSACNKCSHCKVTNTNGTTIKDYGEKCGTSTDVNEYENSSKKDAVQYGGNFNCTN